MAERKQSDKQRDEAKQPTYNQNAGQPASGGAVQPPQPKTESTSEYEGNPKDHPTGNPPVETKTETSKDSGQ